MKTTTPVIENHKLIKLLTKKEFYDFFRDHVKCFIGMKNEIGEIVKEYREIPLGKARNIRSFRYSEIKTFIVKNHFEDLFLD